MPLETVNLKGVSVMAAGGPFRGKGSPPEGDFFDEQKLQKIADATNRLHEAGELRPVNKIGHDPEQRLLAASGITDGEKPAAGWMNNFRVEAGKLKADIHAVPKKLAELIKAGAYRTRSAELRSLESQTGQKVDSPVVTGLAWLGAQGPAIRTLDDVHALYADYEADVDDDVIVVDYSEEVVWDPNRGFRWVQNKIDREVNKGTPDGKVPRYYVSDVGPDRVLIEEYGSDGPGPSAAWVANFEIDDQDNVKVADRDEWVLAEQRWVKRTREFSDMSEQVARGTADTSSVPDLTLTEEQVKQFAETLGVDADDLTAEQLLEAAKAKPQGREFSDDEIQELKTKAERGEQAATRLYEMERASVLEPALEAGKFEPAELEKWQKDYDENPELITRVLDKMPGDEKLAREYGADDDGDVSEEASEREFGELADYLGIREEDRAGVKQGAAA